MDALGTLVIFLTYLASFLATWLAFKAWHRMLPGNQWLPWARPFAVMMVTLAQWSLCLALELSAQSLTIRETWRILQSVGASLMPVSWYIFAARYSRHENLASARARRLLYIIPLLTTLLALTTRRHALLWQFGQPDDLGTSLITGALPGIWNTLHILYTCALLFAGAAMLLRSRRPTSSRHRHYTLMLVMGALLPYIGYVPQMLGYVGPRQQEPLAFLLAAAVSILAWTVSRHQILDLVPIARETVLTNMPDGVLVMNTQDRVVEVNPTAEKILGRSMRDIRGRRLVELAPEWSDLWYEGIIKGELQTEVEMPGQSGRRCYELRVSPVYTRGKYLTGRLAVLRDITEHKRIESELVARRQLSENLVAVARATAQGTSLQGTLQNSLDITLALTGAEYASLFLLDSSGRVTHSILARGRTTPGSQRKIVGEVMDKGLAGWVVRHRQPARVADTLEDDRWVTFDNQPYTVRSVLVMPITSGDAVPGVLTLQHSRPGFFDDEHEELLRAASDQMALALQKAQLYEEQIQLARRQQTLYEVLKNVGQHLEPDIVVRLATGAIARLTGWSGAGILVPGKDDSYLILRAASGRLASQEGSEFSTGAGEFGRAYRTGQTQSRVDLAAEAIGVDHLSCLPSAIFAPLNHAQGRLGVLVVGVDEPYALNTGDVQLAESLAEAVSLSLTNAQLFQAVADEHSKLQALIESSRDGIILVGKKRYISFLNHMALELLSLRGEPDDWMYRRLPELLASLDGVAPELVQFAASNNAIGAQEPDVGEGEFDLKDRSLRWLSLPVRSEKSTLGRLIVLEDVTREHSLQRLRDDLTHTMVHDLRNPLHVISTSLEILDKKMGSSAESDVLRTLQIASKGTERILHLVDGILHISRLESRRLPLDRRNMELPTLVKSVIENQRPLADGKNITLSAGNGAEQGKLPLVYADEELVERILQNLVGNAIKFTPNGGAVSVLVQPDNRSESHVLRVDVRDTGPGVPASIQDQLFEKFVTGLHAEKGSGLGLAFCKMAVEAHGGRIWVESRTERGAVFSFTLPAAESEDER